MEVCLIFTGINPCGGHKFSFVPLVGFTGRICTPSLLKIWPYIKERSILQDRAHPAQTPRPTFVAGVEAPGPRRQTFCSSGGNPPGFRGEFFPEGRKTTGLTSGSQVFRFHNLLAEHSRRNAAATPHVWNPSHSLPEAGGFECQCIPSHLAICTLDAAPPPRGPTAGSCHNPGTPDRWKPPIFPAPPVVLFAALPLIRSIFQLP